ncbi:hypothetical protein GWE18_37085 [Bradyrhizobium sp. CSA112]|uniref:hypothetical protein n=1 Tax=Bradyrhizobium sp. CSA112 TaxID=2699170 RepID=UPI0023AFBB5E|nr:hypothetical protein [Bradyrhizobium sp. CSA112]MDE5458318.1 hypothetical protein [Bradyrhizobium sp. CSA112]
MLILAGILGLATIQSARAQTNLSAYADFRRKPNQSESGYALKSPRPSSSTGHENSPWFGKAHIRMPRGMPKLSIRRQAMSDFDVSSDIEAARFMFSGRFVFA